MSGRKCRIVLGIYWHSATNVSFYIKLFPSRAGTRWCYITINNSFRSYRRWYNRFPVISILDSNPEDSRKASTASRQGIALDISVTTSINLRAHHTTITGPQTQAWCGVLQLAVVHIAVPGTYVWWPMYDIMRMAGSGTITHHQYYHHHRHLFPPTCCFQRVELWI